jgi:hypothetical protein
MTYAVMLSYRWLLPHLSYEVADRISKGLFFIALKNSPLINPVFQREETLREDFISAVTTSHYTKTNHMLTSADMF